MKIAIQSSLKKGDRVSVKRKDLYYLAVITRIGKKEIHYQLDDGSNFYRDLPTESIQKVYVKKKIEKGMTKTSLTKLLNTDSQEENTWAISDIHGCFEQFKSLLTKIKFTNKDKLYILGDCIDRGPDSKPLLDWLLKQKNVYCLLGNHEDLALQSNVDILLQPWWVRNGGSATLKSFGIQSSKDIPKKYIKWWQSLPLYYKCKNFYLSHAGIDLQHKKPLRDTDTNRNRILWNRDINNKHETKRIVYGHTPHSIEEIEKMSSTSQVCIDGGCAYGGNLVAFNLTNNSIIFVKGRKC
jgi:serine/threonine protein phosphatase 1